MTKYDTEIEATRLAQRFNRLASQISSCKNRRYDVVMCPDCKYVVVEIRGNDFKVL